MPDLNRVFIMGRLTFDPELRRIASGTAVTELRLVTNQNWKGKDGEKREETLYVDAVVWDRQAENCCQYLRKGSSVHVEGSLKLDTWEKDGEKRSKIRINADRVQFLDGKPRDDRQEEPPPSPTAARQEPRAAPAPRAQPAQTSLPVDDDEDGIPF